MVVAAFLFGVLIPEVFAFPDKPLKAIIGYEAGSATDIGARDFFQPLLEKEMGQPIMIVNKPGAASALAMRELYDSKPDGYTIGLSCSINVLKIQGHLPYTHRDFDVLAVPSLTWSVLAVPGKSPFKSTKDLIEFAKANPGKLRMSTTTRGAVFWIQARYFERLTGTKFNLIVNPGGASYVATQLGGGHADVGIASYRPLKSQIDAGNIRILGITMAQRVPGFTQYPTLKEQGIEMVITAWSAHLAPKGLPADVYKKWLTAYAKVAASKEWEERSLKSASNASPECVGEEAVKFLDKDAEIQRPILEEIGTGKKK